jgi:hypothetical protein
MRGKDWTGTYVKQVTPERERTCERRFDPELSPHSNGASMQVSIRCMFLATKDYRSRRPAGPAAHRRRARFHDVRDEAGFRKVCGKSATKQYGEYCDEVVEEVVEEAVRSVLTKESWKAHPEVVEHVGEMVARTSAEGFTKVAEAVRDVDRRGQSTSVCRQRSRKRWQIRN